MEDKDLNQLLKNALSTDFEPNSKLNSNILQKVRENEKMNIRKVRIIPAVAAICCTLLCCSVTAFAAWKYLTPKEVASEYGNEQLAASFKSDDAIVMNKSQIYDAYTVTLLGAVSGKNLTNFCADGEAVSERTYVVVAISKTDGTSMPKTSEDDYGNVPFFISPLIKGLNPQQYNIMSMNGGYFDIVKDGIMYRMIECDNIQLFADRDLYLCVSNTIFYDNDAYKFDEKTGEISVNKNYEGMNLLFDFPLNRDKADKEAAEQYLKKFAFPDETDMQDKANETEETEQNVDIDEIIKQWTLVKEEKVTPDKDGRIYFSYKTKYSSGDGFITEDALFEKGEVGYSKNVNIEDGDHAKNVIIYYRDKNGDITVSAYEKVK